MNSKSYINYFSEIEHLDRTEQQQLLEKARYNAFVVQGLSGKCLFNYFIALIAALIFPVLAFIYFSHFLIAISAASAMGIFIGLLLLRRLNGHLLRKGLGAALSANST